MFKQDKKKCVYCIGCQEDLPLDHNGIKCPQNHHLCTDCSKNYISLMFYEPQHHLPPHCPDCRSELLINTVEMQMNDEESNLFHSLMLSYVVVKTIVNPANEIAVHCPFCSFVEIRQQNGIMFVFCKNVECRKRSCYYCHLECDDREESLSDDSDDDDNWEDKYLSTHYECAAYYPLKSKIEKAIESGSKVECPNCKIGGRKDDACTHMTCVKCNTVYCYVCGLSVNDCDKEPSPSPSIYKHNTNWYMNPLRCPMYLSEISQIDNRWPNEFADEDDCLDFFHRKRIIQNLKRLFEAEDLDEIEHLEQKYKILEKSGLSLDMVLKDDATLIDRDDAL